MNIVHLALVAFLLAGCSMAPTRFAGIGFEDRTYFEAIKDRRL